MPPPKREACCGRSLTRGAQRILAEGVGTFLLCMVVVLSADKGYPTFSAPAFALVALTYALQHLSNHLNPAVSFSMFLNGTLDWRLCLFFVAAQTLGGVLGGVIGNAMRTDAIVSYNPPDQGKAFAVEAAFSGLLVLVYQNACSHKQRAEPNSYFGLAVGMAVLAGGAAVAPISGGCFNPALGMGIDFATLSKDPQTFADIWLYWGAPFAGALLATGFQKLMNAVDKRTVAFPGWLCRCRCLCCREPSGGGGGGANPNQLRYAGYDVGAAAAPAEDDGHVPLIVPLAEFVGTFFLVFTASMAQEPLAVGGVLLALIYTLDHVCGADFNPAVTLAVALRLGRLFKDRGKIAVIVLAQMGGGFAAAFLAYVVAGEVKYPSPSGKRGSDGAVFFEAVWTAALVLTVLTVMTEVTDAEEEAEMADAAAMYTRSGHSKSYHGIATGLVLTAGILSATEGGAGGGGVFNPAVGVPVVVVNSFLAGRDIVPAWICAWDQKGVGG
jgi:aquaporin Z